MSLDLPIRKPSLCGACYLLDMSEFEPYLREGVVLYDQRSG